MAKFKKVDNPKSIQVGMYNPATDIGIPGTRDWGAVFKKPKGGQGVSVGFAMPQEGLLLDLPLTSDNLTGSTFTDISGNGNDALSRNVPTFSDGGMAFNGVDDVTGDYLAFNLVSNDLTTWSVGFWVKDYVVENLDFIFGAASNKLIALNRNSSIQYRDEANDFTVPIDDNAFLSAGEWNLVTIVSNGTNMIGYTDAVEQETATPVTNKLYLAEFGRTFGSETLKPQCKIKRFFFYNRVLTPTEISDIFANTQ